MTQQANNSSLQDFLGRWEAHFHRLRESDSLSESEKERVLSGLTKLREVFDDTWLWENTGIGFVHPLLSRLVNYTPSSQLWLADFGRKLDALKSIAEFGTLAKRLKNGREYLGAEAEVETAAKLITAGVTNIELSPKVTIRGKPKAPDMRATLEGEDIYFEVAILGDSEDSVKAGQTFQELVWPFDPEIIRFCQVHKILAKPRIEEFKAKVQSAISEVKETKEYCYVGEPGILDYLVIHPSKREECKALVERFGMKAEVIGPPIQRDEVRRLKRALQIKSQQLPPERPGMIIVFSSLIYFESPRMFYDTMVYELEDTVYDQNNLVAGVIISKAGEFGESEVYDKPHYTMVRNSSDGLVQETTIVIKNRYSKFSKLAITEKTLSAFTR